MININNYRESINDKYLLKAVFFAGGPGSGKSFIASGMFGKSSSKDNVTFMGTKIINSDDLFELGLDRAHLSRIIDIKNKNEYKAQMEIREWAKKLSNTRQGFYINSLLPIVIDGTGKNYKKIADQAATLRLFGYDVSMVFVNTTLEVALERNELRPRKLDPALVEKMWKEVQANLGKFQKFFGRNNFIIIDNSNTFEPDSKEADDFAKDLYKSGLKLLSQPLKNPMGIGNLKELRRNGKRYLSELASLPIVEKKDRYFNKQKSFKDFY